MYVYIRGRNTIITYKKEEEPQEWEKEEVGIGVPGKGFCMSGDDLL